MTDYVSQEQVSSHGQPIMIDIAWLQFTPTTTKPLQSLKQLCHWSQERTVLLYPVVRNISVQMILRESSYFKSPNLLLKSSHVSFVLEILRSLKAFGCSGLGNSCSLSFRMLMWSFPPLRNPDQNDQSHGAICGGRGRVAARPNWLSSF